eukprot:3730581-Ditylum_brightwellii.AAC.1
MEMVGFLKNEEPADDDVAAKKLKGLLWNSTSSKDVQSQVKFSSLNTCTNSDQAIDTAVSAIPASAGKFTSNNSVGGPAHKVELLDTMEL